MNLLFIQMLIPLIHDTNENLRRDFGILVIQLFDHYTRYPRSDFILFTRLSILMSL
jgi:hypothetical protein